MKPITTKRTINASAVDNETGERLDIPIIETVDTGLITFTTENFMTVDGDAWEYILTLVNEVDACRVIRMGNMLKTEHNIVFNHTKPHTKETLSNFLGIDERSFRRLVNRLVKNNIMAHCICPPSGYTQKVYMINPTLVKKRKTFDKSTMVFFNDLSKQNGINLYQ